jgi:hypothetical protein
MNQSTILLNHKANTRSARYIAGTTYVASLSYVCFLQNINDQIFSTFKYHQK